MSPFKTWTAGEVLTASDVNTYLGKQAVIVCTSGTRPGSPVEGMTIFETDTDKLLSYDGTNWLLPDNVAGGTLGYAQVTADQLGIGTTVTDLTGLTTTVTVGAGRRIRVIYNALIRQNTSASAPRLSVYESTTELQVHLTNIAAGSTATFSGGVVLTPTTGSHTYRLRLSTGAGTTDLLAQAVYPASIFVEDVGV